MQPNTWKYFPFRKITFLKNIYFLENILQQPNTTLMNLLGTPHYVSKKCNPKKKIFIEPWAELV